MIAQETESKMCAFCNGKELVTISVTGMAFPMGEKCYDKAIKHNVQWDEDTKLTELKRRLRHREGLNTPQHPIDRDENL